MFKLNSLPYDFDALNPYISPETLDIHHNRHHKTYIDNLNKLIETTGFFAEEKNIIEVIRKSNTKSEIAIFNNSAQAWNHEFYWNSMKKNGGGHPTGILLDLIKKYSTNNENNAVEKIIEDLKNAALTQFGSGWGWLVYDSEAKELKIMKTSNAFTPITEKHLVPLLTIDVWEHAYYIDFRNKRAEYLDKFFTNVINWKFAEDNLKIALKNDNLIEILK